MAYDLIKISGLPLVTPDSGQDIVVGVGDYAKRINYNAVKADMVGTSPSYTTDTEPYLIRQTTNVGVVGKCALNKIVGGSLGWNQLIQKTGTGWYVYRGTVAYDSTANEFTCTFNGEGIGGLYSTSVASGIPQGHKVLMCAAVKASKSIGFRLYCNNASKNFTASTNYAFYAAVLNTGAANEIDFYLTSAPTSGDIMYVKNAQLIDLTVEFGSTIADYIYSLESATAGAGVAWLSQYIDLGTYHAYDAGSIQSVQATAHVTTGKNLLLPWSSLSYNGVTFLINADGSITASGSISANGITGSKALVLPKGTYTVSGGDENSAIILQVLNVTTGGLYWSRDTTSTFVYNGTDTLTARIWLRGGSAFSNVTIYPQVEFGSTATAYEPYMAHTYPLGSDTLRGIPQLVSNKIQFDGDEKYPDGTIKRKYGSRAYQSGDTSDGATMITDGTTTVYRLATPTTESSTSYQKIQTIDADGTESFTTSSPVPVGHETQTADNVLAALEWLGE